MNNITKFLAAIVLLCNQAITFTANPKNGMSPLYAALGSHDQLIILGQPQGKPSRKEKLQERLGKRNIRSQANTDTIVNWLVGMKLPLAVAQVEAAKINKFNAFRTESPHFSTEEQERTKWNKAFQVLDTMSPTAQVFSLIQVDKNDFCPFLDAIADAPLDVVATLKSYYDRFGLDVRDLQIKTGQNALQIAEWQEKNSPARRYRPAVVQYLKDVFADPIKAQLDEEKIFAAQEEGANAPTKEEEELINRMLGGEPTSQEPAKAKRKKKKKKKKQQAATQQKLVESSEEDNQ